MRTLCGAQSIMLALKEGGDENAQLAALSELCELLAVSSEEALAMFPVNSLLPLLVRAQGSGHCSLGIGSATAPHGSRL